MKVHHPRRDHYCKNWKPVESILLTRMSWVREVVEKKDSLGAVDTVRL